jgi:hypothetical protein
MAFRQETGARTIEAGSTRTGRWLRERRLRIALWIAVVEGILLVVHVIPRWPALFVAAAVIALYLFTGRSLSSDTGRQVAWVAAASQAFVALIPVLVIIVGTVALVAVAILAVLALVFLFTERR